MEDGDERLGALGALGHSVIRGRTLNMLLLKILVCYSRGLSMPGLKLKLNNSSKRFVRLHPKVQQLRLDFSSGLKPRLD